jgi:hypothetical protein
VTGKVDELPHIMLEDFHAQRNGYFTKTNLHMRGTAHILLTENCVHRKVILIFYKNYECFQNIMHKEQIGTYQAVETKSVVMRI